MPLYESFKSIPSMQVEGFTHTELQGVNAEMATSPFPLGHVDKLSVIGRNPRFNKAENSILTLTSGHHGRAYEVNIGRHASILWADEYGNIFTKIGTKGNNLVHPHIHKSNVAPSGFELFGLQDSNSIIRMIKASEILRSHNIDSEAIVKVIEPLELPLAGGVIPLDLFKKKMAEKVWKDNAAENEKCKKTRRPLVTRENLPNLSKALDEMTILITVRALQVSERLADFDQAKSIEEFKALVSNAFYYINLSERARKARDPNYESTSFSVENDQDIERYFKDYLPKKIAHSYAQMHKLGLFHVYSHTGNISTTGAIVDLDSVKGEPLGLGDNPITLEDMSLDIENIVTDGFGFGSVDSTVNKFIPDMDGAFAKTFIKTYTEEMGWDGRLDRFQYISDPIMMGLSMKGEGEMRDYYFDKIKDAHNLNLDINGAELYESVLKLPLDMETFDHEKSDDKNITSLTVLLDHLVSTVYLEHNSKLNNTQYTDDDKEGIYAFCRASFKKSIAEIQDAADIDEESNPTVELIFDAAKRFSVYEASEVINVVLVDLLEKFGWDTDIAYWAPSIRKAIIEADPSHDNFDPYLERFTKQQGWDFEINETQEAITEKFYSKSEQIVATSIKALQETMNLDNDQLIDVLKVTQIINEHNFVDFYFDYIKAEFLKERATEYQSLEENFGEQNAATILSWFQIRECVKLFNTLTSEQKIAIEEEAIRRMLQVKKDFIESSTNN